MAYLLKLTSDDMKAANFVGKRYGWSDWISANLTVGDNFLCEAEAWDLAEYLESDTEGGHSYFPMLSEESNLYRVLTQFLFEELV